MNHVDLRYSKDWGRTWSDWRQIPLGEVGDYVNRVVARRFGSGRHFVFQERITDDCRGDLVAVSIQTEPAGP